MKRYLKHTLITLIVILLAAIVYAAVSLSPQFGIEEAVLLSTIIAKLGGAVYIFMLAAEW